MVVYKKGDGALNRKSKRGNRDKWKHWNSSVETDAAGLPDS